MGVQKVRELDRNDQQFVYTCTCTSERGAVAWSEVMSLRMQVTSAGNRIFWLIKIASEFFVALPKYPKSVILVNMLRFLMIFWTCE